MTFHVFSAMSVVCLNPAQFLDLSVFCRLLFPNAILFQIDASLSANSLSSVALTLSRNSAYVHFDLLFFKILIFFFNRDSI